MFGRSKSDLEMVPQDSNTVAWLILREVQLRNVEAARAGNPMIACQHICFETHKACVRMCF